MELASESSEMELAPVSDMELALVSDMEPESQMTPELQEVCARCHLVHEDHQAWTHAHSRRWPCPRYGLVHAEYRLNAMIHGLANSTASFSSLISTMS